MPRMSKSKKLEWSFFLNDRGRKAYNTLCRRCVHDCKQSFRAVVVICPHYRSKRAKKGGTPFGKASPKEIFGIVAVRSVERRAVSTPHSLGSIVQ